MFRTIMITALLAGAAGPALSADLVTEQPPVAPEAAVEPVIYSWDGAYLGVYGGANWLRGNLDSGATTSHTAAGGSVGKFFGWNTQLDNNIVLGIEGDIGYNWNSQKYNGVNAGTDWNGAVRGRVGYAMDNALVYGAVGWTGTRAYLDPPAGKTEKKMLNGYTLGAGVDYKLTESLFARGEYRFNDYGDRNFGATNVDFKQHAVILGVGYKF